MKTSIPINISGRVYYIDSDAKDLLTEYMNNISYAFQGPEQAEIVSDIENRVHELLTERCYDRDMMEAVTIEDVRDVITTIGRPEEMVEEEYVDVRVNPNGPNCPGGANPNNPGPNPGGNFGGNVGNNGGYHGGSCPPGGYPNGGYGNYGNNGPSPAGGQTPPPFQGTNNGTCNPAPGVKIQKKYFRDPQHAVFGGVIAGLGWYTGFSVPLMRFLVVLFSILSGYYQWPILIYIIAWIIFPAAKTAKERLEMMGQPVTVGAIGDTLTGCPPANAPAGAQTPTQPQQYSTLGEIAIIVAKICLAFLALMCIPVGIGAIIGAFSCLVLLIATIFGYAAQIGIGLAMTNVAFGLAIGFFACVVVSVVCFGIIWAAACVLFNAKALPRKTIIVISIITIVLALGVIISLVVGNVLDAFQPEYFITE